MSATSDLATIQRKTRLITGRTSPSDLTTDELNFYINTYLLYDFPEHLKTQVLKTNYEFVLKPNIDTYDFPIEKYILLQDPIFCQGYQLNFYQDQQLFYNNWPKTEFEQNLFVGASTASNELVGTSLAATITFTGTLANLPVSPGSLSLLLAPSAIAFTDNGDGTLVGGTGGSVINYSTGVFTLNFAALAANNTVSASYNFVPQLTSLSDTPIQRGSLTICAKVGSNDISFIDNSEGSFLSADSFPITGITQASPAVIASPNNSVQVGDLVFISSVFGMTQINGGPYTVTTTTVNSVTISLDTSGFSPYESGGEINVQKGTINYITGAVAIDFGGDVTGNVLANYFPYVASRPNAVLYFDNKLVFRPIPDQCFRVLFQVYQKPVELLQNSQSPELRQWWQLIAYGAAMKIFADNLDMDSLALIQPLYEEQQILTMRSTVTQYARRKISTPYSQSQSNNNNNQNDNFGV